MVKKKKSTKKQKKLPIMYQRNRLMKRPINT